MFSFKRVLIKWGDIAQLEYIEENFQVSFNINRICLYFIEITKFEFVVREINLSATRCQIQAMLHFPCITHTYASIRIYTGIHICQEIIIMHYDIVHRNCVIVTGRA